jgi:hypothetical protein
MPEVDKNANVFVERLNQNLVGIFPKVMEMLENKRKRLQILDTKGHVVKNSPFTTSAFKKDYDVNIHEDKDDDDLCFIMWLQKVV